MSALIALTVLLTWLGASLVALSSAAWTEALGTLLAGAGAAGTLGVHGAAGPALVIAAGALVASLLIATGLPQGWGMMPAGSAPILTLCVVVGAIAAWLASGMLPGALGTAEGAVSLLLIGIGGARFFAARTADAARAAATLLALGIGVASGAYGPALVAPAAGAAVLAAASGRLPLSQA